MELLAVIIALEQLKTAGHEIHIYTDSRYVSEAINQNWLFGWAKKGFAKVKNPDLWKRFYPLFIQHKPQLHWIRGHQGHEENELCDRLAVAACRQESLQTDVFFENQQRDGLF